jgi:hypothetical protein
VSRTRSRRPVSAAAVPNDDQQSVIVNKAVAIDRLAIKVARELGINVHLLLLTRSRVLRVLRTSASG